jgi:hypothetical protein
MTNNNTKAHCNGCIGERNHEILYVKEDVLEGGDGESPGFYEKHELLKCLGCERIIFRVSEWNDMQCDKNGNYIISYLYYPPAISRAYPKWFSYLEHLGYIEKDGAGYIYIHNILKEIYIGLQNDSIRLATLGIRALLEYVMVQKVGDNGSFKKNLNEFEKQGHISSSQNIILNSVLETGHATMHRSYSPTKKDLVTCIDITENLIATIFIHTREADKLLKKIPPRK